MGMLFTGSRLTTAVLLCGGHSEDLSPLIKDGHGCMLPLVNRPLIEHTVEVLEASGIKNIFISMPREDSEAAWHVKKLRKSKQNTDIRLVEEDRPTGTAGALRSVRGLFGDECFLVISSNLFIEDIDLEEMLSAHTAKKSVVTVGVMKDRAYPTEEISVDEKGGVKGFTAIHPSRDRRTPYAPLGIYVFNRQALAFIKEDGYFDIREQLIPAVIGASLPVHIHEVRGLCRTINCIEDYYEASRQALADRVHIGSMIEVAEGVWAGSNTDISHRAYIVGPVVIGDGGRVEDNAQIIGPASIGNNCVIGKRAFIRESILLDGCEMEEDSSLRYCIAGRGVRVCSEDEFENKIVVEDLRLGDLNLVPSRYQLRGVAESLKLNFGSFKYKAFLLVKRLMDILASAALLVLLAPVMFFICALIKRDSVGPCVFSQKRCGKDGRDFVMYKFRTMVKDASSLQQKLSAEKNVDGPMFKLFKDPRVTRIGEKLRKTSLDELPQLINVLRGEMSLVGPRPLVMDEMKFSPSWRSIRLKVKPGVTGLWQVQGRSEASFHDWIRYDVDYVKNQSLWLDLKILFKTVKVVFQKAGAY